MTKEKVTIELPIVDAQELALYLEKKVSAIDWVINNQRLTKAKADALDESAKLLTRVANIMKKSLHARAKANSSTNNVVKLAK